ncbi:MAG TPA: OmpW family outer membrane protein [Acidocella sp.]|nr:OmpW family outer membrane protein [Acidocella sp.]
MKSMFRAVATAALLAGTAYTPALAQGYQDPSHYNLFSGPTGYQAGDIMTHLSIIGVIPENRNSHVNVPGGPTVGNLNVSSGVSPELDASYFFTPNLSIQLIAATSRHTISARLAGVSGNQTLGSTWVLPPTLTAQWHFPQIGIIRPYVGVGITVAFFYGTSPSNHDALGLRTSVGPAFDAGFDVPLQGNWTANVDVKQMFLPTAARLGHGAVHAMTNLDPTVVGFGVGYKF